MITELLVAGMNRYRAWIDDGHVLIASQLLSMLIMATAWLIFWSLTFGWSWAVPVIAALIPVEAYLGIAQMTNWRDGS